MTPMRPDRFRLYNLGTDRPAGLRGDIREVWEAESENEVAALAVDGQGTTQLLHLVRDTAGRFTPVGEIKVFASLGAGRGAVARLLRETEPRPAGDQAGLDLFTRVAPQAALHPYFRRLEVIPHSLPARRVLAELGPWMQSGDPHFVR